MKIGLVLTKIRGIMAIDWGTWAREFVLHNNACTKNSTNQLEKSIFKGLSNFAYGK